MASWALPLVTRLTFYQHCIRHVLAFKIVRCPKPYLPMKPKIVFIHGMFLTSRCWESWRTYFTERGYECVAPEWPLHHGAPADLRENMPDGLGKLSLADLYSSIDSLLRAEREPPILIGHSLGGLIVQKMVSLGLARAGVALCSVAPNRMLSLDWGFLRNTASITNPFAGDDPYPMTPEGFHQNFCNTMTEQESAAAYEKHAVHESRQVLRDILGNAGELDLTLPHVPLLFVGAEKDEIIPSSLVKRNAEAYEDDRSHSEFLEFSSRCHFIIGQPGWEEVADGVGNWLEGHLTAVRS